MTINIFEKAAKQKLRIQSDKGALTVEQLYDLSLTNLDKIARKVNAELKSLEEESFVDLKPNPQKYSLDLQLNILKTVIKTKLDEKAASEAAMEKANKRKILLEALDMREKEDLLNKSKEEILAELENL